MGGFEIAGERATYLLTVAREIQIPVLAVLLLGACVAKTRRAVSKRSVAAGIGPTAMFPVRLRGPIAAALFASEFALAVGLVLTAGRIGAGPPALVVRSATALLFGTAVAALSELRARQPDAGCGCFGDLSHTPVTWRALVRSALLCAAAIATISAHPLHLPNSGRQAVVVLVAVAVELLLLASLSPEIGEIMVRLGYSEPCEVRRLPVSRTLATLRGSSQWRRYRRYLVSTEPIDVWREGCWRYVVFPANLASRRVEVVFAVYLKPRRAPVRAGIYDATADRRARETIDIASLVIPPVVPPAIQVVPAPRREPVRAHSDPVLLSAPVVLSAQAHGAVLHPPHGASHHVTHHRQRHSADF